MVRLLFCIGFLFFFGNILAQENDVWFFLRASDTIVAPTFEKSGTDLIYSGDDPRFKQITSKYRIFQFKKTYRHARKENLKKTFFVRADNAQLMTDILQKMPDMFVFGELVAAEDKKIFEPNDYGLTSTIGENIGAQVNLDYLDVMKVPKAWYYTTGSPEILVGVSDGFIDTSDPEFAGRSKMYQKSTLSKGHGYSVAASIGATGDNGYGIAGVCYGCSLGSTTYGDSKNLKQLIELSEAGAKVINCSWGTTGYYETAQEVINELYEKGTVIVAAGHNKSYDVARGKVLYYPASYDKVIAVSSGMHRYQDYQDNIQIGTDKKGKSYYYIENIRGYVGRTGGFRQNDTLRQPYIWYKSVRNLNSAIDILGPATGIYRYGEKALNNLDAASVTSQTSGVAPLITGSIGLMFSLYPCLPVDEVESILKMTSWNIDHLPPNKPFAGLYGSGMIQTGDAVEMVFQLYTENETAYIQNQDFSRWDFKLTSLSKEVQIRNQKFTDSATLNVIAKQRIVIGVNTHLRPDSKGSIHLKIDPTLQKECDLVLRDPSILENSGE